MLDLVQEISLGRGPDGEPLRLTVCALVSEQDYAACDTDGTVEVPWSKPGLGVEVDRERVESLTVRRATETPRVVETTR